MATMLAPKKKARTKNSSKKMDPFMEVLRQNRLPDHFPVPDPLADGLNHRSICGEILSQSQTPIHDENPPASAEKIDYVPLMENLQREAAAVREAREFSKSTFPLEALPKSLCDWVVGISLQSNTAPETAALSALAAGAAAMRNGNCVQPISGWEEPLNLYVGLITRPGDQSDAVLHAAAAPLLELEFSELDARGTDDHYGPDNPRRLIDEVTARSLNFHLAQRSRISSLSTSGEVFRQLAGRRSISRDRLVALLERCHDARDFVATLPRGKDEVVERPGVSIASLIDRSLVSSIGKQRECPARTLMSCFLFAEPDNRPSTKRVEVPMPEEFGVAYGEGIRRLASWSRGPMRLEVEAAKLFYDWICVIDGEIATGPLAPIAEWAKRLGGTTLRIAGLLHAWESDDTFIPRATIAAAIEIARWLVPQAASALAQLGAADDDCDELERAVLRLARVTREFSGRSAWQRLRKTCERPANLRQALAALVSRGHLREIKAGKRFGLISQVERLEAFASPPDECAESTPPEANAPPPDEPEQAAILP